MEITIKVQGGSLINQLIDCSVVIIQNKINLICSKKLSILLQILKKNIVKCQIQIFSFFECNKESTQSVLHYQWLLTIKNKKILKVDQ